LAFSFLSLHAFGPFTLHRAIYHSAWSPDQASILTKTASIWINFGLNGVPVKRKNKKGAPFFKERLAKNGTKGCGAGN